MGILVSKFLVPPLTIFDTRMDYWQKRKNYWGMLGMDSGDGRSVTTIEQFDYEKYGKKMSSKQSIFDPVLCEVIYTYFTKPGYNIIDPFAGGSVRGIIAEKLGRNYIGIDVRKEQVDSNIKQAKKIGVEPKWAHRNSATLDIKHKYDFLFTCPPYYDLEVYDKELKGDISNCDTYDEFLGYYTSITKKFINSINDDRFMCYVVSNVRDKNTGAYYDLVGDTNRIFMDSGCKLYNDIVLINSYATAGVRASAQFEAYRKVIKVHQNCMVYYKGNIKNIKENFGKVELNKKGPLDGYW